MSAALGIDLGGTRIKGVAITAEGNILHQLYVNTNDGNDAVWKKAVRDTVSELWKRTDGKAGVIGISAPGLPNDRNTSIAFMPGRLQGLENLEWKDFFGTSCLRC